MTAALIGRDHPFGVLRAEIARAVESHGGLVLVTGEAGIGKTTLVTAAADEASRLGALVLSGSCWASGSAPGYWPWVQVVRGLRRSVGADEWAAAKEAAGDGLSALMGEAPGPAPAERAPSGGAPGREDAEAFEVYDAVTTALVTASQRRPVLVVLDDLHWADAASLKLLEFAAQHTWFERLLLIGTYRDAEVDAPAHPLQPLVAPLLAKATTVTLTGMDRSEVGVLIARTTGTEPDADLVAAVHDRTGGNPFFVEQTARLWRSGSAVTAIAPGVRDALHRRLSLLPEPVTRLLTSASVLGREFHRQVVAATAGAPVPEVDRLLDQAVTVRLVVVRGGGQFAFVHDLVRETLYESLDETQARRQHAAVVRALARSPALAERVFPADRARHAYLAGAELEPSRAVDLLLAAARDAHSRMAVEEAIGHQRRALERVDDPARRVHILLQLAGNLYHVAERAEAWQCFAEAAAVAREHGDPPLLARVAITVYRYGDAGAGAAGAAGLKDDLVRAAHRGLVGGPATPGAASPDAASPDTASPGSAPPESAASLDRLAEDLIAHTERLARHGNDDEALAFSLWARHDSMWGPGTARERETLTAEMASVARRAGDRESEYYAASLRWVALLERGDPRYLDQFDSLIAMIEPDQGLQFRMMGVIDRSIIAAFTGRFEEAQALLDEMSSFGEAGHTDHAFMIHHLYWALWLLQGRFDEIDDLLRPLTRDDHAHLGLLVAVTAIEKGDVEAAARHVADREAAGKRYSRSMLSLWLRLQAQVAAATRDPAMCERARAALAPHGGEWAVSLYGCDISGPIDLWVGLIEAAQRRWDDAVERLTAARRSAERLGSRPWCVIAGAELAAALRGRAGPGDARAAEVLLDEVAQRATEIGMRQIVDRVHRIRSAAAVAAGPAAPGPRSARSEATGATREGGEFVRDGAVWRLGYAGHTVHLPDAKGLRDLHVLLARPGTDVAAAELLDPAGGAVVAEARLGADEVLDGVAKERYKRRLAQLDDEIDRAAGRGDDVRVAELDRERQALLHELRAAAGLAGRGRRLGDAAERARKTVTARIRDTLRRLDAVHPELAAHLRAAVSTGVSCRYDPDGPVRWRL